MPKYEQTVIHTLLPKMGIAANRQKVLANTYADMNISLID